MRHASAVLGAPVALVALVVLAGFAARSPDRLAVADAPSRATVPLVQPSSTTAPGRIVVSGAVAAQAERQQPAIQVTPTDPPPPTTTVPTGLNGLPFAPPGLTGCDRMEWYADQAGLPEQFHWIGYEESRCDNQASSWCCHGYFQIHEGWVNWAATAARNRCDVTHASQFDARTPIARQRNACMAKLVFDEQGFCAWDVVPWC